MFEERVKKNKNTSQQKMKMPENENEKIFTNTSQYKSNISGQF